MKQSLTYYLTLFVLKLKGIKKSFSQDPIDFKKIRKEDVFSPRGSFFKKNISQVFKISDSELTEIKPTTKSDKLLIFIHGGAFISGPAQHHWDTIKHISKETNYTIWLCNYPKAPENKISTISENLDAIYAFALQNYESDEISLIGDSVGGTLVTALTQRLVMRDQPIPQKVILISPVMDASMSHPDIEKIDFIDPMLSKIGVLSAKKMCAENGNLSDPAISPINGSFEKFPRTLIFIAENDITYPDQKLVVEKLKKANVNLECIEGKSMPHIWPLLPVMKEAKAALNQLINSLNE